ncbi:MAG: phosphoribosylanthranilate isomerase [Melioribacteraceae bacterium]
MKVKICGITNIEDAMLCSNLGADAIGFIFYKKSKRYIAPEKAKEIIKQLPIFLLKAGVFVNEQPEKINKIGKELKLNIVQLHGEEPPEDVDIVDLPVIKAFRVDETFDYRILLNYKNCSFLLDSFDEKEYGGTGKKFDWKNIPKELKQKIILAGGISIKNLEYIYKEITPYAIDASSSIESLPGKKDTTKLKDFLSELNRLRKY